MGIKNKNSLIINNKTCLIFIFVWAFILYGNTLKNDYSMDYSYVLNEQTKQGISAVPDIFRTRYIQKGKINYGYRPVTKTTFAIEQSLWGNNPFLSHLINILLYSILSMLLFKFLIRIFKNLSLIFPFFIVILFMAHPTHSEIVAGLKNRDELLSVMFGLLMMNNIWKYIETNKMITLLYAGIFLMLGYWSKPTILIFVLLLPVFLFYFTKVPIKKNIIATLIFIAVLYFSMKLPAFYTPHGMRDVLYYENPFYNMAFLERFPNVFSILFFYLKKVIIPFPLLFYYGYNMVPVIGYSSVIFWISFFVHAGMFVLAIYLFKKDKYLSFALLGYLFSIVLFSGLYKPLSGIVAERYLFVATLPFTLGIVRLIFLASKTDMSLPVIPKPKSILILGLILLPYSLITINRNNLWQNELSLFSHDIPKLKNSALANEMYGAALMRAIEETNNQQLKTKYLNDAMGAFKQSIAVYPNNKFCLNTLASSYFIYYRDYPSAAKYYEELIKIDTTNVESYLNLGFSYEKIKNPKKAIKIYNDALRIDSINPKTYSLLANAYYKIHNLKDGDRYNNILHQLYPKSELPIVNLANYYIMLHDTQMAVLLYDSAANIQPQNKQLNTLLYQYYLTKKDTNKIVKYYKRLTEN